MSLKRKPLSDTDHKEAAKRIVSDQYTDEPGRSKRLLSEAVGVLTAPQLIQSSSAKPPSPNRQKLLPRQQSSKQSIKTASIDHWCKTGSWPEEMSKNAGPSLLDPLEYVIARKASARSFKRSQDDSTMSGNTTVELTRAELDADYRHTYYETSLENKHFYMDEGEVGPSQKSLDMVKRLFSTDHEVPKDSWFQEATFNKTMRMFRESNEMEVMCEIGRLIVPSARKFVALGEENVSPHLLDGVGKSWKQCISITRTQPVPDFSCGWRSSAFEKQHLEKLRPLLGDSITEISYFRNTLLMSFAFLTSEVKAGDASLSVADRQNAHSMFIAVRAMVLLHQVAGCEKDINREILAFSVSHNSRDVRIYGYYPVIPDGVINLEDNPVKYYRHPVRAYDLTNDNGREKWTSYKFVKSIYTEWAPLHLEMIRAVLAKIPVDTADWKMYKPPGTGSTQQPATNEISHIDVEALESETLDYNVATVDASSLTARLSTEMQASGTMETSATSPGAKTQAHKRRKHDK